MRKVAVLGSTGSIGKQALEVIEKSPSLSLYSIVCGTSAGVLEEQRIRYMPFFASAANSSDPENILLKAVEGADIVLNGIVGSAGLRASLLCQQLGKPLALANKESLVIGSDLLSPHLEAGLVIPVDSEHSTIFRCLMGEAEAARSITLTASGGSLRDLPMDSIYSASPEMVLDHPTWNMGGRITVDSATMVNKAFEVLEARALFPGVKVDVVVHRNSIVHSFVECADGAWKALMGLPDMKVPIAWALHYPDLPALRVADESPLDWGTLSFQPLDNNRYPAFTEVLKAGDMGGTAPAAANAADEVAVAAFLSGKIPFGEISGIIGMVVEELGSQPVHCLEKLDETDEKARAAARKAVEQLCFR